MPLVDRECMLCGRVEPRDFQLGIGIYCSTCELLIEEFEALARSSEKAAKAWLSTWAKLPGHGGTWYQNHHLDECLRRVLHYSSTAAQEFVLSYTEWMEEGGHKRPKPVIGDWDSHSA